jgi:hypothetical protein
MFHSYQEERKPRMQAAFDASAFITRLQACDGNLKHFIMRYVFPAQGQASYADKLAELVCGAPKLDFLPIKYSNHSTFKWKDEAPHVSSTTSLKKQLVLGKAQNFVVMELASLFSLVLLFFTLFGTSVNEAITTPKALNISAEIF